MVAETISSALTYGLLHLSVAILKDNNQLICGADMSINGYLSFPLNHIDSIMNRKVNSNGHVMHGFSPFCQTG